MTDEEILEKIFKTGDDNNTYIELTGGEIGTSQLLEPSLSLDQMVLKDYDNKSQRNHPERLSFRVPLVSINKFFIQQSNITNFYVDYSGFLPTMMIEFLDVENRFLSTAFPKEGSMMQLFIGGNGDEMYYKPIRQDFIITNIQRSGNPGRTQETGFPLKYRISGSLSIPGGSRKESWCDAKVNARQALFNLSVYTGLGFATNFVKDNDVDSMQWNNSQNRTLIDFMKDVANHACYSQYSFFTSFIDQYYVFNFIECHSLLSHGGQKTDTPAMIYTNVQQPSHPYNDNSKNGGNKQTSNEISVNDMYDDLFNTEQKVSYYYITNNNKFNGWSNFIEVYSEINNGFNSLNDGYRVHLAYADSNIDEWGCRNCEFVLSPIDNLKREGSGKQISELPENVTQESYIPLNLVQTTNSVYLDTDMNSPDNIASMESFVSVGEVDTTNTFKLYYFAKAQNDYQMRCLKKCGLNIRLQNYNPAITKFSRIWVDIYDKNPSSIQNIKPRDIHDSWSDSYKETIKGLNDDILFFPDEADKDSIGGVYNRALSGWYIVTEMKIVFDRKRKTLQSELVLNRIEYQPNLKSDYTIAKRSINEKYRYDNTTGSWFNNMDDYSFDVETSDNSQSTESNDSDSTNQTTQKAQ